MEDLIIYRRKRGKGGQFLSDCKFAMRFQVKDGRFTVFSNLANKLNIKDGDAVMFAFSKKQNSAFVFKEEPDHDSYICKHANEGRNYFRFTSKDLVHYFIEFFNIVNQDVVYLEIDGEINEKGYLNLKPFIKEIVKL
jgi:hypothetical protein